MSEEWLHGIPSEDLKIEADKVGRSRRVKVTHRPTGLTEESSYSPSQVENLQRATGRLADALKIQLIKDVAASVGQGGLVE